MCNHNFISDTLLGVIVGGVFASLGTIGTLISQHRMWKKEKRIEDLRLQKSELETLYKGVEVDLSGVTENMSMNPRAFSNINHRYPENVRNVFKKFIGSKTDTERLSHYYSIIDEMSASISEIDGKITKELD